MSDNIGSEKEPVEIDSSAAAENVEKRRSLCAVFPPHPILRVGELVPENLHHVRSMCWHDSFILYANTCTWERNVSLSWIFALDSPVWICYGKKVEVVVIHQISRLGFSTSLQKYISVSLALEKMPSFHVLNWKDLFPTSVTSFSII